MTEPRCDKCKHFRELIIHGAEKHYNICDLLLSDPDGFALAVSQHDKCEMFTEKTVAPRNCPFCGGLADIGTAESGTRFFVYCVDCDARSALLKTRAAAVEMWNNRVKRMIPDIKTFRVTEFLKAEKQ